MCCFSDRVDCADTATCGDPMGAATGRAAEIPWALAIPGVAVVP